MDLLAAVTARLAALGYTVTEADNWALGFVLESVTQSILNRCHLTDVPDGLTYAIVDRTAGQFLRETKAQGRLEGFDLDAAVKQLQEGDTNITYAIGDGAKTPEARIDEVIGALLMSGEADIACFRKLAW